LALVKNGVPWDVAMNLDPIERQGMCIRFGIMEGGVFDWETGGWRKRDA
jgi:hypothetical protein